MVMKTFMVVVILVLFVGALAPEATATEADLVSEVEKITAPQTRLEVDASGQVWEVESPKRETRKLTAEEDEAVKHPGREVPVGLIIKNSKRIDFFHRQMISKTDHAIVFRDGKIHPVEKEIVVEGEVVFSVDAILAIVSIILMAVSNFLYRKKYGHVFYVIATVIPIALATFYVALVQYAVVATVFLVAALVSFLALAVVVLESHNEKDRKAYAILSVFFYLLMAAGMLL